MYRTTVIKHLVFPMLTWEMNPRRMLQEFNISTSPKICCCITCE